MLFRFDENYLLFLISQNQQLHKAKALKGQFFHQPSHILAQSMHGLHSFLVF